MPVESLPRTEAPPPAAEPDGTNEPSAGGPPHLADPRALQILSTEHWGLLTARSLVYNETFTRGSMFLTFLSASLVALGFVYQGGGGPDFAFVLVAILALDLFVGLATLGRIVGASMEEFYALQGMNRIRHAYLEMVPTLRAYLSGSPYDDAGSVLSAYGATPAKPSVLLNVTHGLTTMPGLIGVIDATLVGALVGAIVAAAGGDTRASVVTGLVAAVIGIGAMLGLSVRVFGGQSRRLIARFPAPDAAPLQPPGRRNT
jgi:hypothetical protein